MGRLRRLIKGLLAGGLMFALPAWVMGHYAAWPAFPLGFLVLLPLVPVNMLIDLLDLEWRVRASSHQYPRVTLELLEPFRVLYTPLELAGVAVVAWSVMVGLLFAVSRPKAAPPDRTESGLANLIHRGFSRPQTWLMLAPSLLTLALVIGDSARNEWAMNELRAFSSLQPGAPMTRRIFEATAVMRPFEGCQLVALEVRQGMDAQTAVRFYGRMARPLRWSGGSSIAAIRDGALVMVNPPSAPSSVIFGMQILAQLTRQTPRLKHLSEEDTYVVVTNRPAPLTTVPGDLRCAWTDDEVLAHMTDRDRQIELSRNLLMSMPTPAGLTEQEQVAYRILRAPGKWGIAEGTIALSMPSVNLTAFLKLTQSRESARVFRLLLGEADFVGQLYALTALYRLDRPLFDARIPLYRKVNRTMASGTGCVPRLFSSDEIVPELESGKATEQFWGQWESSSDPRRNLKRFVAMELEYDGRYGRFKDRPRSSWSGRSRRAVPTSETSDELDFPGLNDD